MRAPANGAGNSCSVVAAGQGGEFARNRLGEVVVVQIPGRGKDHIAAMEAVAVIAHQAVLVESGHRRGRSQNRPAERMAFPEGLRKQLMHQHIRIVLVDLDLFQNHPALALDVGRGEDGIEHQVGQHIQSNGHMLGQRLHVEADGLLAGEGVQVAADRIHLAGDVLRRARARALEEHMLDKVRDAVGLRRLAARAAFDPHSHGHRTHILHALGQHDQAVRQYGAAKISFRGHRHRFFDCRPKRSEMRRVAAQNALS